MKLLHRVEKLEQSSRTALAGMKAIEGRRDLPKDVRALSLLDWARLFLPQYASLPYNGMHRRISADAGTAARSRGSRFSYTGPRDTGKSVLLSLALPLRCAVEGTDPYILLVSETAPQAIKFLDAVREELRTNDLLAAMYPHSARIGPVWQQSKVQFLNGVVIEAVGTGKSLRGSRNRQSRPTLIVADDLQGDKHIWSPRLRQKLDTWFGGELMKAGAPGCNVFVAGNAVHRDAIVCKLGKRPGWRGETFRSIVEWPDRMDLWGEWESILTDGANPAREANALEFYRQHEAEMHRGASVLWPERVSLYSLMVERASEGHTAFERERQSNPVSVESVEWPETVFDGEDLWFDEWPALVHSVTAIDPSTGTDSRKGDYSAIVTAGYGEDGLVYVDADLARRPVHQIASDAIAAFQINRSDQILSESVAFQQWVSAEIDRQAKERKLFIPLGAVAPDAAKIVRIRRLGPYLSTRRIRFKRHSKGTRLLFDQLREFPGGQHDDGPDALEMGIRALQSIVNGPAA
ncbi:MAG: phage terminase large subunit [Planctomycetes bacterium]|nr:phage terminase large subunit [Planctomycetota bacterium]